MYSSCPCSWAKMGGKTHRERMQNKVGYMCDDGPWERKRTKRLTDWRVSVRAWLSIKWEEGITELHPDGEDECLLNLWSKFQGEAFLRKLCEKSEKTGSLDRAVWGAVRRLSVGGPFRALGFLPWLFPGQTAVLGVCPLWSLFLWIPDPQELPLQAQLRKASVDCADPDSQPVRKDALFILVGPCA